MLEKLRQKRLDSSTGGENVASLHVKGEPRGAVRILCGSCCQRKRCIMYKDRLNSHEKAMKISNFQIYFINGNVGEHVM